MHVSPLYLCPTASPVYFSAVIMSSILHSPSLPPPLSLSLSLRHPRSSSRPNPRDIVLALMENEETVLRIPSDDAGTHSMAATLGAPLEAGDNMYHDLQGIYYSLQTQT